MCGNATLRNRVNNTTFGLVSMGAIRQSAILDVRRELDETLAEDSPNFGNKLDLTNSGNVYNPTIRRSLDQSSESSRVDTFTILSRYFANL